jgi:dolichol kinase
VIYFFIDRKEALFILGPLTLGMVGLDLLRIRNRGVNRLFLGMFENFLRNAEYSHRMTGASWVFVGSLLTILIFPKAIAITAILILSTGDATAALVGKRYGRYPIMGKTVEGTLAFIAAGIIFTSWVPTVPFLVKIIGALAGALVELPKTFIDDNLLIPLVSGAVMYGLLSLLN